MDGIIEITNRSHNIEVMEMFRDFSVSETYTDVQLIAKGGRKVFAHKLVLVSLSRLLKTILLNMPYSTEMTTIHLPDVTYRTLRLVINFLYIGSMRLNTTEKADFFALLNILEIDIKLKDTENDKPSTETNQTGPSTETNQTGPMVVTSDPLPVQQPSMAASQSGPIVVNSFTQNPFALALANAVGVMGNGTQHFQHHQMPITTANHSDTAAQQQNMEQQLSPLTTVTNPANCLGQANCLLQSPPNNNMLANCLLQSPSNNPVANCLNSTQQLVQVLPIAFANQLQQFVTSGANLMPTTSGGGLVAFANLPTCSGTVGSQLAAITQQQQQQQQLMPDKNYPAAGLGLMTSTPMMTATVAVAATAAGGGGGAVIDLSTDDSRPPPSPPSTTPATVAAPDCSPNRNRRKRQADPEAAAQLAKRLQDASGQLQASSKDIIDLDND